MWPLNLPLFFFLVIFFFFKKWEKFLLKKKTWNITALSRLLSSLLCIFLFETVKNFTHPHTRTTISRGNEKVENLLTYSVAFPFVFFFSFISKSKATLVSALLFTKNVGFGIRLTEGGDELPPKKNLENYVVLPRRIIFFFSKFVFLSHKLVEELLAICGSLHGQQQPSNWQKKEERQVLLCFRLFFSLCTHTSLKSTQRDVLYYTVKKHEGLY